MSVTALWDPQQREWLQAMGYSLLVLAGDEAAPVVADREDVGEAPKIVEGGCEPGAEADPGPPAATGPQPAPRARPTPPLPDLASAAPAPTRPRTDAAAKLAALEVAAREAGAVRNFSGPFGEALLRATGQPPAAATRVLRELAIDPAALRDDPGAKRALWARLRSLRKGAQ